MRVTKPQRLKLEAFLKEFYKRFPSEKFTIFHYVRYFKKRLKDKKLDAWNGVCGDTGCLSGKTILKGYDIPLNEIYDTFKKMPVPLRIYDWKNEIEKIGYGKIISSGIKRIYRLKTNKGNYIYASKDHKFFILENDKIIEKELKDIKKGDKLVNSN